MSLDDLRWTHLPVIRELHDQWWSARARRIGESQRPFSRDWDQLLEDAGLTSAEQRREAEKDVRLLEASGLVQVRSVKYRPYLIERILVPVSAEQRLAMLFGDPICAESDAVDLADVDWCPELTFLKSARVAVARDDLLRLNIFLADRPHHRPMVPIKERSLQIFGDEKRLDALLASSLFRSDRLMLEMLRCEIVGEPLGWRRGPASAKEKPLLVIENAATWHSYCRWNADRGLFSAVVYGKGFQSAANIQYLHEILSEVGGKRRLLYFGDIDPPGLQIPQQASSYAAAHGLPPVEPHMWSYQQLFEVGRGKETDWGGEPANESITEWLGELSVQARELLSRKKRLAQEHVGWEFLASRRGNPT